MFRQLAVLLTLQGSVPGAAPAPAAGGLFQRQSRSPTAGGSGDDTQQCQSAISAAGCRSASAVRVCVSHGLPRLSLCSAAGGRLCLSAVGRYVFKWAAVQDSCMEGYTADTVRFWGEGMYLHWRRTYVQVGGP